MPIKSILIFDPFESNVTTSSYLMKVLYPQAAIAIMMAHIQQTLYCNFLVVVYLIFSFRIVVLDPLCYVRYMGHLLKVGGCNVL